MAIYDQLKESLGVIWQKLDFEPEVAIVLGSGLGGFAQEIEDAVTVPYSEIPAMPQCTVDTHVGQFVFGKLEGVRVACMQGRFHYYEGYTPEQVVMPIRLLNMLGAEKLILTNAAGGINPDFKPGDLMLFTDHIASFMPSPLRGENIDALGPRFPDMSEVYDSALREKIREAAVKAALPVREGVFLQTPGPQYETPAEIRMFAGLGADAVAMSTAIEAIAARHMGMTVCAVSCITNMAAGISAQKLSHEEVKAAAEKASENFEKLVRIAVDAMYDL
ncbi:MAG: purine-nucleoside phosphorylase [Oscillospiraceae bacterium]|nr:purine-nucleoside phosphorylase [Oscillospiraceae bacterium]